MANTKAQRVAEEWVVSDGLPKVFPSVTFKNRKMKLEWGGNFAFDAVSRNGKIVGLISTSSARTSGNKPAIAKFQKIRADALFLLHVKRAERRLIIFTEKCMLNHFEDEKKEGRFPPNIELLHVELPDNIQHEVVNTRKIASEENSPNKRAVYF